MTRKSITVALAVAAFGASTAIAMGWPNNPPRKVASATSTQDDCGCSVTAASKTAKNPAQAPIVASDGWVYRGGESGWEPGQHKYTLREGKAAMADDCPVSIAREKREKGAPA